MMTSGGNLDLVIPYWEWDLCASGSDQDDHPNDHNERCANRYYPIQSFLLHACDLLSILGNKMDCSIL